MKYITPLLFDKTMDVFRFIYDRARFSDRYDLFRMKDITDSFSRGQVMSKEWLVRELKPFFKEHHQSILVIGGWYGLLPHMLVETGWDKQIKSYELDDVCIEIGLKMQVHDNIIWKHEDGLELFTDKKTNKGNKIVVCTACEHIDDEDLHSMLSMKHPDMIVALQSNNMVQVDSHINCHTSVDHFVSTLPDMDILYKGTMDAGDYERYMVIAK